MPVIMYKTMTLNLIWVQVRRIRCEHCHNAFRYLAVGTRQVQTAGLPVVSSSDGMRSQIGKQVDKLLGKLAKKPRQGRGLCPHCQRYQGWMVRASRWTRYGWGAGSGLFVGMIIGVLGMVVWHRSFLGPTILVGGLAVCTAIGLFIAHRGVLPSGVLKGKVDRRAMNDSDWSGHQDVCREKEYQPALAWYAMTGGQFQEKIPVVPMADYEERPG